MMKELLLIGLPSDVSYPIEVINIIKAFNPEALLVEYSSKFREQLNSDKVNELVLGDFYSLFGKSIEPISPGIPEFNDEGLTWMEYYEGVNALRLMENHSRLAFILGGSHLPSNEAPVETPLIKTLMTGDYDIHFRLINYLSINDINEHYSHLANRVSILEKTYLIL